MPSCVVCGHHTTSGCRRCRRTFYCSREHQVHHWRRHRHHCYPEGHLFASKNPSIELADRLPSFVKAGPQRANIFRQFMKFFSFEQHKFDDPGVDRLIERLRKSFPVVCGSKFLGFEDFEINLNYAKEHGDRFTILLLTHDFASPTRRVEDQDFPIATFVLLQSPKHPYTKEKAREIVYICSRYFRVDQDVGFSIGKIIHAFALYYLARKQIHDLYLEATATNKGYYERLGYEESSRRFSRPDRHWSDMFHFVEKADVWGPLMRLNFTVATSTLIRLAMQDAEKATEIISAVPPVDRPHVLWKKVKRTA